MNQIQNIVVISLCLFLLSCTEKQECVPIKYFSDGSLKICLQESLSKATGKSCYEEYYKNGNIEMKFCMENGLLSGSVLLYREDGSIEIEGQYLKGKMNGNINYFCEGGGIEKYIYYVNGNQIYFNNIGCSKNRNGEIFIPILNILSDTITELNPILKFSVSMPLPDDIKRGRKFYFVYGLSDMKYQDSLILKNHNELELDSKNVSTGEVYLSKRGKQYFFGYVLDKDNKDVYNPFDREIFFKEGVGYIVSPAPKETVH